MSAQVQRPTYEDFIAAKNATTPMRGFHVPPESISAVLFPFQRDIVQWALRRGRAAIFASFGLGKTFQQLEVGRQVRLHAGDASRFLIVAPLGVRAEFMGDAAKLGLSLTFVQTDAECAEPGLYITNYESIRDGKLDPRGFTGVSLDEASALRGGGKTLTFREFMKYFEGGEVPYLFVATATPSPNDYLELLLYAQFLGIMDVGQAKTRFFKRDSQKADALTLHPHKADEFWRWVASWALFVTRPSDLGHSDDRYTLPPLNVHWHELPSDHANAGFERSGQGVLLKSTAAGIVAASREKRSSLDARVAKVMELVRALRTGPPPAEPGPHAASSLADQLVIWCDLNDEQEAIEAALKAEGISVSSLYGREKIDAREKLVAQWRAGETSVFLSKPVMYGAGINLQQSHTMIFAGIGFKFQDFIQAIHRIYRFLQTHACDVHILHTEAERDVRAVLERKWRQHDALVAQMTALVREYGLTRCALDEVLTRATTVTRREVVTESCRLVNHDSVFEARTLEEGSIDLIVTSVPFGNQYEYAASLFDMGHTDNPAHFFQQMDYLTPELFRTLKPGRVMAVHVKDRIVPGGLTGFGFQTLYPFHADCIRHYMEHGFALLGMVTVTTDVVRENNQTNRLGYSEMCKDGSRMGVGVPEYVILLRKPQTNRDKGYADAPVEKRKEDYKLSRWQIDAAGYARSSGNRLLTPEDFRGLTHDQIFKLFRRYNLGNVYDFQHHVALNEALEARGALPVDFSLLQVQSWSEHVWSDVTRMRTLNGAQSMKGREMHLCLARGSLVLTWNGYVPIETLIPGDQVLTHEGRWRPVTAKVRTGTKAVTRVTAQGVADLRVTPDHKLWTRTARTKHPRKIAQRAAPGWVPAAETLGSYVNLKLPPVVESPLSAEEWWVVGRWLGDGHRDARGGLIITCGHHEAEGLITRLGARAGTAYDGETATQIRIKDRGGRLRSVIDRCGHGAGGKRLPGEAISLDREKSEALLSGYLSADGHRVEKHQRWCATSVSRALLLGMAMVAQRARGVVASVYAGRPGGEDVIEGRTVKTRDEWVLTIPPSNRSAMMLDDGAWKKVRALEEVGETEVWDISVADDASFTAEGCVVKNCPFQFDIVERLIERYSMPGETVLDPFGGLMTVPMLAVKLKRRGVGFELNARYFDDGVAYVRAAERDASMPMLFDLDTLGAANDDAAPLDAVSPLRPPVHAAPKSDGAQRTVFELLPQNDTNPTAAAEG